MGDSDEKPLPALAPAATPESQPDQQDNSATPESQLDIARRFLDDDEVKSASREKKVEFLRSKGIDEADIKSLLQKTQEAAQDVQETPGSSEISLPTSAKADSKSDIPPSTTSNPSDRPPIVTYPEFLAKPTRPPPLVTTNRLLHTLNGFAILSTALYGVSRFVINPMVENLTDARVELHETAASKLGDLVAKLEQTVSVIPPSRKQTDTASVADTADDVEDPAEMFHRDVGTQTSVPPSPSPATAQDLTTSPSQYQLGRLTSLAKSLSSLKDDYRTQSEDLEDIKTIIDVFRDDLDAMTYGSQTDFVGGYDIYSRQRKPEPEDEIKKVRDNIRRVKGVLLSTRNFPTSTRR